MTALAALKARRPERSGHLPEDPPIRLLIVDDSSVARAVLSRMVGTQPDFVVAATAGSVLEALTVLRRVTVDIVLLDIEMPGGSGLEGLPAIVEAGRGARVLVVSSMAEEGAETTVKALSLGAADTMPKPGSGMFNGRFSEVLAERLRRIGRMVPGTHGSTTGPRGSVVLREVQDWQPACLAIGASTGGIHAIHEFIAGLPRRTGLPILITQHLPPLFMPYFARQLEAVAQRPVRVAAHDELLEADHVVIAPGNAHLRLSRRGSNVRVKLDTEPAPSGCLPSVDPMLESVAEAFGPGALAIMLSGMGRDGLIGSGRLVERGGIVLAQDQNSSAIWGMPRAVAEAGLASAVLPPRDLARRLTAQLGAGPWN